MCRHVVCGPTTLGHAQSEQRRLISCLFMIISTTVAIHFTVGRRKVREDFCLCANETERRRTSSATGGGFNVLSVCVWTYPTLSSSSSLEPDAVFVGRSSSGRIFEPLLLLSKVVSASFLVCATFSITLPVVPPPPPPPPPVVRSDRCGLRAARCFRALLRSAW